MNVLTEACDFSVLLCCLFVINKHCMQKQSRLQKLTRLRRALRHRLTDLESSLQVVFGRAPLIKGNVYEMARKCGKPSCACRRGELHRTMVLSWSQRGKTRLFSIPPDRLAELRQKSEEYLRFRRTRASVSEICKAMLVLLDRIEKLRREAP
jgi:Family of unknown function (DUF6788)